MDKKRILLTGGRTFYTLELARRLKGEGHTIFVAETMRYHICRWSLSVKRSYQVPSPRENSGAFVKALGEIVDREKIDILIPVFEETLHVSRHLDLIKDKCKVVCQKFGALNALHNKWLFYLTLCAHGLAAPKTVLAETRQDLDNLPFTHAYALKACYSRASLDIHKIEAGAAPPALHISPSRPYVAQQWMEGRRYCTYGICQEGQLLAHSTYPVDFAADGRYCLSFEAMEHPAILDWVNRFVRLEKFTGQIAFDFVEGEDGTLYAIECNPRATSGVNIFGKDQRLQVAFVNGEEWPVVARPGTRRQIFMGMLMYGWRVLPPGKSFFGYLRELFTTPDTVFSLRDPGPVLMMPVTMAAYLVQCWRKKLTLPALFTHDYEWNGE